MIYSPVNLFLTLQFIIGYFFVVFMFYSFYEKVKLKFSIGYNFFQKGLIFFTCFEMPVNITQYRGSVRNIQQPVTLFLGQNPQTSAINVGALITYISNCIIRYFE